MNLNSIPKGLQLGSLRKPQPGDDVPTPNIDEAVERYWKGSNRVVYPTPNLIEFYKELNKYLDKPRGPVFRYTGDITDDEVLYLYYVKGFEVFPSRQENNTIVEIRINFGPK